MSKLTELIHRKGIMILVAFLFLSFGFAGTGVLLESISSGKYETLSVDKVFAQDDDDDDDDEEEEAEELPRREDADLIKDGFLKAPELDANADNPNTILMRQDQYEIPQAKWNLFGWSNRDATWILAALHILFASFILGCPMFIVVSEACGAEKTPGVNKANVFLCLLLGIFAGSIVGMIGEVIGDAHGAVIAVTKGTAAAGLIVGLMVMMGTITEANKGKMGSIVGIAVAAILSFIFAHENGTAAAVIGAIAGLIAGMGGSSIMLAKKQPMLERLAHECMNVVTVCYSFTALTGGFFFFLLVAFYPSFITYLIKSFGQLTTVWYPVLFIVETVIMYCYYYMWDTMNKTDRKGLHITIGLLLNIAGLSLLILMDAPAAYQTSPTKLEGSLKAIATLTEWDRINNPTWWGLNFHRMVGNLTYGGFVVGFIGALMFLWSDNKEDRAYYDWQGYIGNALGLGFMLPLPAMGYILAKEIYNYDAAIGMYIMSDRLSMMMLMQGVLIGFLFIGANFYMWVSMKRVSGHEKYLLPMKVGFVLIFVCWAIWYSPRHFFATMGIEPGMILDAVNPLDPTKPEKTAYLLQTELPPHLSIFALMFAKNTAATSMVFISLINYVIYRVACAKGTLEFGKVNPLSQYILIFLAFSDIWLMTWMGGIRSLARRDYHIYKIMKDLTVDAFTPTVAHSASITTVIVWIFFSIITAIVWMQLKYTKHGGGH